jgi:hypothetical protein
MLPSIRTTSIIRADRTSLFVVGNAGRSSRVRREGPFCRHRRKMCLRCPRYWRRRLNVESRSGGALHRGQTLFGKKRKTHLDARLTLYCPYTSSRMRMAYCRRPRHLLDLHRCSTVQISELLASTGHTKFLRAAIRRHPQLGRNDRKVTLCRLLRLGSTLELLHRPTRVHICRHQCNVL